MFTGIVQHVGTVIARSDVDFGSVVTVDFAGWSYVPVPGASVAVDGCCLTATTGGGAGEGAGAAAGGAARAAAGTAARGVRFDIIRQTLDNTTLGGLSTGDRVNLEPALAATDRLDGHFVQGHIDGVGRVIDVRSDAEEWRLRIEPPADLLDYIVKRGSIAVDGVSLTIAEIDAASFEVALIPTTLERTTLGARKVGGGVNLETDCVARTVVHWLRRGGSTE